jgi:Domain of unknown function (DUF3394).
VEGENFFGEQVSKHVVLPVDHSLESGKARINDTGLMLREEDDKLLVDMIQFGSDADKAGIDFDWQIKTVTIDNVRPWKEWVFVPTLLLLALLGWNQRRRIRQA